MKFIHNERQKHYIVGVLVIASLAIVFLPSFFKKASDHYDDKFNIAIKLPEKPTLPKVNIPDEPAEFQTMNVAQVNLSTEKEVDLKTTSMNPVQAKAISVMRAEKTLVNEIKNKDVAQASAMSDTSPKSKKINLTKSKNIPHTATPPVYAVQLASFTKKKNAEVLVSRLLKQGYSAYYDLQPGKKAAYYKVYVGKTTKKQVAEQLQQQLAEKVHLNGFVIKTGVS